MDRGFIWGGAGAGGAGAGAGYFSNANCSHVPRFIYTGPVVFIPAVLFNLCLYIVVYYFIFPLLFRSFFSSIFLLIDSNFYDYHVVIFFLSGVINE